MVKIFLLLLIIVLWVIGGQKKGSIRDIPIPIILAVYFAVILKAWWLFFALAATYQIIRLGYGNYSPEDDPKPSFLAWLLKDRKGWYIRMAWGFLVALVGSLPLFLCKFLGLGGYLGYIALNTAVNFLVSRLRLPVILADVCVSASLGSIIFIV